MLICDLHCELDDTHDRVTLVPRGPINEADLPALADSLTDALRSGAYEIDLDLSRVPTMADEALVVLREIRAMIDEFGGHLCLRNPTPPVMALLVVAALA